jgi:hypothetical protein
MNQSFWTRGEIKSAGSKGKIALDGEDVAGGAFGERTDILP